MPDLDAPPAWVAPHRRLATMRRQRTDRAIIARLFDGEWREALLSGGQTQFAWRRLARSTGRSDIKETDERIQTLLVNLNIVESALTMHGDIIAGHPPIVTVSDGFEGQRDYLSSLRGTLLFDAMYHEASVRTATEGQAVLRVGTVSAPGLDGPGRSITSVRLESNERWFGVGDDGADGQPDVWEGRWIIQRGSGDHRARKRYLRIERHRLDKTGELVIDHEAYRIDDSPSVADQRGPRDRGLLAPAETLRRVTLDEAIGSADVPEELVRTGMDRHVIVRLVNYMRDGEARPRLQRGDVSLVDAVAKQWTDAVRAGQLHLSPKVRISRDLIDKDTGEVDLSLEAFIDPHKIIDYIVSTFDADGVIAFLNVGIQWLLVRLGSAPALLGFKPSGGAAPDSYDKLRLEATLPLSVAQRAVPYHQAALARLLTTASLVESRRPLRGWPVTDVEVTVRPQLPKDRQQTARDQAELLAAGLTSQRAAFRAIHGERLGEELYDQAAQERDQETERRRRELLLAPAGLESSSIADEGVL